MRFNKIVFITLLATFTAAAQKPVGISGFVGNYLDYYTLSGASSWAYPWGDTFYFTAWANNSMLPLFPDPNGLPVFGTTNDGKQSVACKGPGSA